MKTGNITVTNSCAEMFINHVKNFTSPVHHHFTRQYNIYKTHTVCDILLYMHSFSCQRGLLCLDNVYD
jgi:hypothetical protein